MTRFSDYMSFCTSHFFLSSLITSLFTAVKVRSWRTCLTVQKKHTHKHVLTHKLLGFIVYVFCSISPNMSMNALTALTSDCIHNSSLYFSFFYYTGSFKGMCKQIDHFPEDADYEADASEYFLRESISTSVYILRTYYMFSSIFHWIFLGLLSIMFSPFTSLLPSWNSPFSMTISK